MSRKIWLQGGFGNILFQIIPALKLNGIEIQLDSYLTKNNIFTYFFRWKIHSPEFENFFMKSDFNFNVIDTHNPFVGFHIILGFISKKMKSPFLRYFYFHNNNDEINFLSKGNYFGYYQNKLFLQNHKTQLEKIFKELRSVYYDQFLQVECSVHFRYGDSVWAKQNFDYYNKVKIHLLKQNIEVTIVTDSITEANNFFQELPNFNVISGEVMRDFSILLSSNILYSAPSTFSWWAANASLASEIYVPEYLDLKLGLFNKRIKKI